MTSNCSVNPETLLEALAEPFEPKEIEWRVQSASRGQNGTQLLVVPYIDSRSVMNRLDDVCKTHWQSHFDKIEVGGKEAFQCRLSIYIGNEWITRTDAAEVSDIEGVKGGHSNALKRAAVQFKIGRYLYGLPKFWVPLQDSGEHRVFGKFKISGKQEQLKGYFNPPTLPNWALPAAMQKQQDPKGTKKPEQKKSQESKNNNRKPSQQEQDLTEDQKKEMVLERVKRLCEYLEIPNGFPVPLLKKANEGKSINFGTATTEELRKLYQVLLPVNFYVTECRKLGLNEDDMIYYAQITCKVKLESIHSLYFKMSKQIAEETLELVPEGNSQQAV
ncbi:MULTISPECIES: Rad52/Rad22 family DNA repair protein [Bacillus]|uniref:Rad52/Rad22 family DNA repair protein n=1 Tax=Bacillus TaxID=1386 RepID=UPI00273FAB6B|nr:Rad52/Rad22 family DNA repair protein [Bacillus sp. MMSF_3328]